MTIQDIIDQIKDWTTLFNVGDSGDDRIIRAINRSVEYYQRRLGLPSNEFTTDILYYGETEIPLPDDFNEPIQLRYDNDSLNTKDSQFYYVADTDFEKTTGETKTTNIFSTTIKNGTKILYLRPIVKTIYSKDTIEAFDDYATATSISAILSASTGLSALSGENDSYNYKEGEASLYLKATVSSATPTISIPIDDISMSGLTTDKDVFALWLYLDSNVVSFLNQVKFKYTENSTNYEIMGSLPFTKQEGWNLVLFTARDVENFDYTDLTNVSIDISFTGASGSFVIGLDELSFRVVDKLKLDYYSNYKGKNASGTYITNFSSTTDVPLFGSVVPDLLLPISLRAAFYLAPNLKTNPDFTTMFYQESANTIKIIGRQYPKKRIINYGKLEFDRNYGK